jgi:hypothetical protein
MIVFVFFIYFASSFAIIAAYSILVARYAQIEHLLMNLRLLRIFWLVAGPLGALATLFYPEPLVTFAFCVIVIAGYFGGTRYYVWLIALTTQRLYESGQTLSNETVRRRLAMTIEMWPKLFMKVARRHGTEWEQVEQKLLHD